MTIESALNCLWAEVARYNENSRVRDAWQTLKAAVEIANNTQQANHEICAFIDNLPLDKLSEAGWLSTVTVLEEIRRRLS